MSEKIASALNEHISFKQFSDKISQDNIKCMNLIACFNDILYLWNLRDGCIDCINIKSVLAGDRNKRMQLRLIPDIYFAVERLTLNSCGTLLALSGESGLATVVIPGRWQESVLDVPAVPLGQGFLLGEHVSLRTVAWHPASPTDSYLMILTTDECVRLYNALEGDLIWQHSLASHFRSSVPSAISLGDTPIDFAFTLPDCTGRTVRWPILVLWGNGDVYRVMTSVEAYPNRMETEGPLRMEPPAEDNYGLDASGITVLETQPPLVVIATSRGNLYHSLLLSVDGEMVLHVTERLSVDAGITLDAVDSDDSGMQCPIWVDCDPRSPSKYLALTPAGLISVSVPLVSALRSGNTSIKSSASTCNSLVATGLKSGFSNLSPPLGVTHIDTITLLVLLSSGRILALASSSTAVDFTAEDSLANLTIKDDMEEVENMKPALLDHINKLLCEGGLARCPALALPAQSSSKKDWLDIVNGTLSKYRSVLASHVTVAAAISQRVELLREAVKRQQDDLNSLMNVQRDLRTNAESIAEKYEDVAESLPPLTRRAEILLTKLHQQSSTHGGMSTSGERQMAHTLELAQKRVSKLKQDHEAVKASLTVIQQTSTLPQKSDDASEPKTVPFEGGKTNLVYRHIKHLNLEINNLISRINKAQVLADSCHIPVVNE